MESAITEASFTCDALEANKFHNNTDLHVDKEARAIFMGWYSAHTGQGFGEVEFVYLGRALSDPLYSDQRVQVTIGLNGDPFDVSMPYEGCWAQEEDITLYAYPFVKDGYRYTFDHWEWADWETGEVFESVDHNPYQFSVFPDEWTSVHYYRAVFTGGEFHGQIVTPGVSTTAIQAGEPYLVMWSVTEGIRNTSTVYLDYSSNGGSSWTTILGPVPYNYGYEALAASSAAPEDAAGCFSWNVPVSLSANCRLRLRASDQAGNSTTALSSAFSIVSCLPPYGSMSRQHLWGRTFRFTATIDPDTPVDSLRWDFDDGVVLTTTAVQVDHACARGGYLWPSVTLINSCGSYAARSSSPIGMGCWYTTPDADGDLIADDCDICPNFINPDQDDSDGDHVGDECDNCLAISNYDQLDSDGDGKGDLCDNCPGSANTSQVDTDVDGYGDLCDNCPTLANANQQDSDGDGKGNLCDNCPYFSNPSQLDSDGDGAGNPCDNCPSLANAGQANSDGDALGDSCDNCPHDSNPDQADFNGDGVGDACCCVGRVGDVNGNGVDEPSVGDISVLISVLFTVGTCDGLIDCFAEADVNQSGGSAPDCSSITIGDISYLIDYIFVTGPTLGLAECL